MTGFIGKYKERELLLEARIKELENLLCPAEQHDYVKVNELEHLVGSHGSTVLHQTFVCRRCLKRTTKDVFVP